MLHFQLVSTRGTKFDGDVYEVLVPAQGGTIALFEDHMPLISSCQPGVISVRKKPNDSDDEMENFATSGGVVQIDGKIVRFLSDEVTSTEELSEAEAEAAQKRAEELMANAGNQIALHEAKRALQHTSAKLHVARMKRRKHM
jgi:F-type H+-transporting ATPase subunit epsilon